MARRLQMQSLVIAVLVWTRAFAVPVSVPSDFPPLSVSSLGDRGAAAVPLQTAVTAAQRILDVVRLAVVPRADDPASGWALGATLARYAAAETGDPRRVESTRDYSRRTLAGGAPGRISPEVLIALLRADADLILSAGSEIERLVPVGDKESRAAVVDLRVVAALGRFHALRLSAAVHYNLFLRAQRLAELVAATYVEKDALQAWRELMAAASEAERFGARLRPLRLAADWSADLARLEASVRDLESQCCPPDPVLLQEKTWKPAVVAPAVAPRIDVSRTDEGMFRVFLRGSVPSEYVRATLFIRSRGETNFREFPLGPSSDGGLEAKVPSSDAVLEGFVGFEGPGGPGFAPAPWERPSLMKLRGT